MGYRGVRDRGLGGYKGVFGVKQGIWYGVSKCKYLSKAFWCNITCYFKLLIMNISFKEIKEQ